MKVTTPAAGTVCVSLQGRDKGNLYCVVQMLDGNRVEVADGRAKKLSRPKIKNIKHIRLTSQNVANFGFAGFEGKDADTRLAYALKCCKAALGDGQSK